MSDCFAQPLNRHRRHTRIFEKTGRLVSCSYPWLAFLTRQFHLQVLVLCLSFSFVRSTCSYRILLLEGGWDRAAFCLLWILTKLVERTNEVSLVGRVGLQCVNERAGCLPFWDSSLLRPLFVQTDVLLASVWFFLPPAHSSLKGPWLRHCDRGGCLFCREFRFLLPLNHGFVTVNVMVCNEEFVFVVKNLLLLLRR